MLSTALPRLVHWVATRGSTNTCLRVRQLGLLLDHQEAPHARRASHTTVSSAVAWKPLPLSAIHHMLHPRHHPLQRLARSRRRSHLGHALQVRMCSVVEVRSMGMQPPEQRASLDAVWNRVRSAVLSVSVVRVSLVPSMFGFRRPWMMPFLVHLFLTLLVGGGRGLDQLSSASFLKIHRQRCSSTKSSQVSSYLSCIRWLHLGLASCWPVGAHCCVGRWYLES